MLNQFFVAKFAQQIFDDNCLCVVLVHAFLSIARKFSVEEESDKKIV